MHASWWITPLLLLAPLAGCMGSPDAEATGPTSSSGGGPGFRPPAGFQLEGPTITPLDERERELREDDVALVRYTLRQPAEAATASSAQVSFLLNGEVQDVQTVTLAPGEAKEFERRVEGLHELPRVSVMVRAGAATGQASADVVPWPRLGEWLTLGDYVRVNVGGWTRNETGDETLVQVSLARGSLVFRDFRSHILCLTPDGQVESVGSYRPAVVAGPGGSETLEVHLPLCPGETYGVDFKADVEGGKTIYGRVLFVPTGWRPPVAPTP